MLICRWNSVLRSPIHFPSGRLDLIESISHENTLGRICGGSASVHYPPHYRRIRRKLRPNDLITGLWSWKIRRGTEWADDGRWSDGLMEFVSIDNVPSRTRLSIRRSLGTRLDGPLPECRVCRNVDHFLSNYSVAWQACWAQLPKSNYKNNFLVVGEQVPPGGLDWIKIIKLFLN